MHANMLNLTLNPYNFEMLNNHIIYMGILLCQSTMPNHTETIVSIVPSYDEHDPQDHIADEKEEDCVSIIWGMSPNKESNQGWTRKCLNIAMGRTKQKPIGKESM